MKKKHVNLLQYLITKDENITSNELAAALKVSTRTIKSYISEIHYDYPGLITSSNQGYKVIPNSANILIHLNDEIPQDYEERCFYIIKKLLLEKNKSIDLFDLCDELYVSISTLKKDIMKMNTSFASFSIHFLCTSNQVIIQGSEINKRKLISHVMSEEASGNFIDLNFLEESFPNYDLHKLTTLLKQVFQDHHFYINDFAFLNLILHIVIMVDRIKQGNHFNHSQVEPIKNSKEQHFIEALCIELEQFFTINFTFSEQFEIFILFKTNVNYQLDHNVDELQKVISEDIFSITKRIIEGVDEHFFVDLSSDSFITPFSLHLKNLKLRLLYQNHIKNPMAENIKNSCPTIYDISTFMAYQLMQEFHTSISEDEIAFLALHVGTEIERQKSNRMKVRCIVLCPEYLNIHEKLSNQLLLDFGEQITIIKNLSYEVDLSQEDFDLLLTTVPFRESLAYQCVELPPFPTTYNKSKLMEAITTVQNRKKGQILHDNIDIYFNDKLFYIHENIKDKNEIISILSQQMMKLGYVDTSFKDEVMKRERASSTAFMKIAIPHPMKMGANKTCISVWIDRDGIEWDKNHMVNAVFMIAFNRIDNKRFHELYEALILLFNESCVISDIKKCCNFYDFKQILIKNYMDLF